MLLAFKALRKFLDLPLLCRSSLHRGYFVLNHPELHENLILLQKIIITPTMNNQPNLFRYATSELSQDAAIMWLLEWARPSNKANDPKLHEIGRQLLESLYKVSGRNLSDYDDVIIKPQEKKIDILIEVITGDEKTAILIEDKIKSSHHSNQLKRYLDYVRGTKKYKKIIPVYFKTGFQPRLTKVLENGYFHYSVQDFLSVLQKGKELAVQNNIFGDFLRHVEKLHENYLGSKNSFENYADKSVSDWTWWSWYGFFSDFQQSFTKSEEGWGTVPSRRGSLLASWFGHEEFLFEKDQKSLLFKPFIDVRFEKDRNIFLISYRLHLNNNKELNREARDHVKKELIARLKDKDLKFKESWYKPANDTIEILKIQGYKIEGKRDLLNMLGSLKLILKESVEATRAVEQDF